MVSFTCSNVPVDPLTFNTVDPLPIIVELELTLKPNAGLTDAVTLPEAICDKFNPTIPVAGMFVNPDPFPWNDPLKVPLNIPFPVDAKDDDKAYDALVALNAYEADVLFNAYDADVLFNAYDADVLFNEYEALIAFRT